MLFRRNKNKGPLTRNKETLLPLDPGPEYRDFKPLTIDRFEINGNAGTQIARVNHMLAPEDSISVKTSVSNLGCSVSYYREKAKGAPDDIIYSFTKFEHNSRPEDYYQRIALDNKELSALIEGRDMAYMSHAY